MESATETGLGASCSKGGRVLRGVSSAAAIAGAVQASPVSRNGYHSNRFRIALALAVLLVAAVTPSRAAAGESAEHWRLRPRPSEKPATGETLLTPIEGRFDQAGDGYLQPGATGAHFALPSSVRTKGRIAFEYKPAPVEGRDGPVQVLRVGDSTLTLVGDYLLWVGANQAKTLQESAAQFVRDQYHYPIHVSTLGFKEGGTIEASWSETEARVFFRGMEVASAEAPEAVIAPGDRVVLLNGGFRSIEIAADMSRAGLRHTGVIYMEPFEGDIASRWAGNIPDEDGAYQIVSGALGSERAIAQRSAPYLARLQWTCPRFRVTRDTVFCMTVKSNDDRVSVNVATPGNHFIRSDVTPGEWTPLRIPMSRFELEPGQEVVQIFVGNFEKHTTKSIALDNVAVIRGNEAPRSAAPAALKAQLQGDAAVALNWQPASSPTGVTAYGIYRSNRPDFTPSEGNHVGQVRGLRFVDEMLTQPDTWYYRVAAIDYLDQTGEAAGPVDVTVPAP